MFLPLLLLLACIDVTLVTKIEDILICINDTDCESTESSVAYTRSSKVDNSALEDSSNDTEKDNSSTITTTTTTIPIETTISLKIKSNVTEQPELQSTVTSTMSSPAVTVPQNDNETLVLEKKEICECDLTIFSCDINCCCDVDCNRSHLAAFSHCQDRHVAFYDSRYCYNRNFIQRNNTPFILEKLANNLFCVLYDNLPSMYSVDNDLTSEKDLWKTVQMKKYTWKVENGKATLKYNLSKYYQHGDILWKLHDKSIEPIEFLQSGFTGICSFKKTLRYLEDWKGACIQSELTNVNRYLFPVTFNNFTVIGSLPSFNETFITEQACKSNVCLPIRTHYCANSFSACNRTRISGSCANFTCTYIVRGLRYVISHNGSAGVSGIDAYFDMGNASHAFYQRFEVRYVWVDLNETRVFARSGNPGYATGKPIVVGTSRANGSDEILFNRTDGSYLTLPVASRNGECSRIDRHIVAFGEDAKLRCSVKLSVKNFTASTCAELQNVTMRLLMHESLLNASQRNGAYVSKLGNFTSKNTADWSRIVFDRIPQNVVTARAIGKRILCSGLVTSVHMDVLYSILPKPKTSTSYKILGVGVTFSKEEDISWPKCTLKNCTDVLSVDVLSYINFHDISEPSKYYFVGGPNLDITLPYDFFYPFLNSSKTMEVSNILVLLIMYIGFYIS